MRKTYPLNYTVNSKPGFPLVLALGFQHLLVISGALVFVYVLVASIGGTITDASRMIATSMSVMGIATILQALRKGPVGSGYLCPQHAGPAFLGTLIATAKLGGLPLLFGMTVFSGVCEGIFSRFIKRLQILFPPQVIGTILILMAIQLIPIGLKNVFTATGPDLFSCTRGTIVGVFSLGVMLILSIWGGRFLKTLSLLFGIATGLILALLLGVFDNGRFQSAVSLPLFDPRVFHLSRLSFDSSLIIPFILIAIISSIKTTAGIAACQRINSEGRGQFDMKNIGKGILACSSGNILAGLSGGMLMTVSSTNIGVEIATGAAARIIAFTLGGLLILLSFFPKLSGFLFLIPAPVIGACVIFGACYLVVTGIRMLSFDRHRLAKAFIIGLPLAVAVFCETSPSLLKNAHPWLQPLLSSSLAIGSCLSIFLSCFFFIAWRKTAFIKLNPEKDSSEKVFSFLEKNCRQWGVGNEMITHAAGAVSEILEYAPYTDTTHSEISVEAVYKDPSLEINISFFGSVIRFPPKNEKPALHPPESRQFMEIAPHIISKMADHATCVNERGQCHIILRYER